LLKSKKLSLIAVLALLGATIVAPPAWAATVNCSVGGSITITDNVVTGHTTCEGSVEIPNTVTSIGNNAFQNATALASVTFEADSVLTSFNNRAFLDALALTSITIPNSVTSIGEYAFSGATSLTSLNFEADSVLTSIGTGAFLGATALSSITIPNSVTSIGIASFKATSLTSITIPNSVTSIGYQAFYGASLASLTFEAGSVLTSIGKQAFYGATSLTSITIPNSVTSIEDNAFYGATSLTSLTFEAGSVLTSIGDSAFYGATSLTSITIPNSVTSIGDFAFYGATSSTSLTFEADSVLELLGGISAFGFATSLTSITIPNSVTSIGDFAFNGATSLTSLTFEAGSVLTSIGEQAFYGATSLTSITIPTSVTSIGHSAFQASTSLTSVTFEGNAPDVDSFGPGFASAAFSNVGTDAVANIGFAATGFGEDITWNGLILVRAAAPATYTGPLLQEFSSRTLDVCTPKSITITGIRLLDATASVQGKPVTILENTDTKLVLAVPAGLTPGNNVDLVINSSSGTLTHQDAFDIPADTCTAVLSKGRWTQLQSDGKTVKIYAKDPIGDGKIQFFVDGKEIAWVNAVDEADPKLSFASSYPYLVRSVALHEGKNRFEIKLDGVRVWRATYVPKG